MREAGAGADSQAPCAHVAARSPPRGGHGAPSDRPSGLAAAAPAPARGPGLGGVSLRALQPGGTWNLPTRGSPRSPSAALSCEVAEDAPWCGAWLASVGTPDPCFVPLLIIAK